MHALHTRTNTYSDALYEVTMKIMWISRTVLDLKYTTGTITVVMVVSVIWCHKIANATTLTLDVPTSYRSGIALASYLKPNAH